VEEWIGRELSPDERHGLVSGEHAGTWETAWYLAQRPELIGPEYEALAEDHPPPLPGLARFGAWLDRRLPRRAHAKSRLSLGETLGSLAGSLGWLLNARTGYGRGGVRVTYSGWPAVAALDVGRAYAELPVRDCLADLEAITAGRLDPLDVRSIASDPLVIQPHFARLVLAAAALVATALVWWWV
jgi:hypothetical protein